VTWVFWPQGGRPGAIFVEPPASARFEKGQAFDGKRGRGKEVCSQSLGQKEWEGRVGFAERLEEFDVLGVEGEEVQSPIEENLDKGAVRHGKGNGD
jgi:hypothetical protein